MTAGRVDLLAAVAQIFSAPDGPTRRAAIEVFARLDESGGSAISAHQLEMILDELEVGVLADDVRDVLLMTGLVEAHFDGLRLATEAVVEVERDYGVFTGVPMADVRELLRKPVAIARRSVPPVEYSRVVTRVAAWAQQIIGIAADRGIEGFPVFWQRDTEPSVPISNDTGSMAQVDTLACLLEPVRFGIQLDPAPNDAQLRAGWRRAVDGVVIEPSDWYDGSVRHEGFDDDFVGSFVPALAARGACPTTEAIANRATGLLTIARTTEDPSGDLIARTATAVEAIVGCLGRWQSATGVWSIHRYPDGRTMPDRDVSTQYAAEALLDALASDLLSAETAASCFEQLVKLADGLAKSAHTDGECVWWDGDYVMGDAASRLRTTTMMAMILGRIGRAITDSRMLELQRGSLAYVLSNWKPAADATFETTFRCPTWDGPALSTFTWDMARDAFAVSALLDGAHHGLDLGPEGERRVVEAVEGLIDVEFEGSWLDIPMYREGKRRAFVSNTVHNLRAVIAACRWIRASIPV